MSAPGREALGALVREVWTEWAAEQPDPKPSWLTPWAELDAGQREVDMRIGVTVAAAARAAERERVIALLVSPSAYLIGLVDGMRKVTGAGGEDWQRWIGCLEQVRDELSLLVDES